jgi:hypothetical protein
MAGTLMFAATATAIGVVAALIGVGIDGRPDDVVLEIAGHHMGGSLDRQIAIGIAVVGGTIGVIAAMRFASQVRRARRSHQSGLELTRGDSSDAVAPSAGL